jgi:hypothetical protein
MCSPGYEIFPLTEQAVRNDVLMCIPDYEVLPLMEQAVMS